MEHDSDYELSDPPTGSARDAANLYIVLRLWYEQGADKVYPAILPLQSEHSAYGSDIKANVFLSLVLYSDMADFYRL